MQKNLDIVDEVTADQIRKRNERRQTSETRRKLAARRSIEEHQERLALKRELEDGIGLDHNPVKTCLNCGNQLVNKPATAKFCKENCRKSYWKRNKT